MIVTDKNNSLLAAYTPGFNYVRHSKSGNIIEVCEDYTVNISDEAKRLQSGEQEDAMQIATTHGSYGNTAAKTTKTSAPMPTSQPTFDDVLTETSRPEPKPVKNGVSADDEVWLPERLRSLTLSRSKYVDKFNSSYEYITKMALQGGEKPPNRPFGAETEAQSLKLDLCPQWYADLAQISVDPSDPNYKEQVAEYYSRLKEAMEQVLSSTNIPADDWGKHYDSLISNTTKSEKIHQELLAILKSDPRTLELMDTLGVASEGRTPAETLTGR